MPYSHYLYNVFMISTHTCTLTCWVPPKPIRLEHIDMGDLPVWVRVWELFWIPMGLPVPMPSFTRKCRGVVRLSGIQGLQYVSGSSHNNADNKSCISDDLLLSLPVCKARPIIHDDRFNTIIHYLSHGTYI